MPEKSHHVAEQFVKALSGLFSAKANPFTAGRLEVEREIMAAIGERFVPRKPEDTTAKSHHMSANVKTIDRCAQHYSDYARRELKVTRDPEWQHDLENLLLYQLYATYREPQDRDPNCPGPSIDRLVLIGARIEHLRKRGEDCAELLRLAQDYTQHVLWPAYRRDFRDSLGSITTSSESSPIYDNDGAHWFAVLFQIRRAFFLCKLLVGLGASPEASSLRAQIWNAIFGGRGLRVYCDRLWECLPQAPLLIMGPTGSGKELVARAIGFSSYLAFDPKQEFEADGNFTALFFPSNVCEVSPSLLESYLFGHRKGAYTGANENRDGLFQSRGCETILMDEIAELPRQLQVKLLRVLESRQFQRLGESRTWEALKARLVFATNKDLSSLVEQGEFRQDFLSRISTVRIVCPGLTESLDSLCAVNHQTACGPLTGQVDLRRLVRVIVAQELLEPPELQLGEVQTSVMDARVELITHNGQAKKGRESELEKLARKRDTSRHMQARKLAEIERFTQGILAWLNSHGGLELLRRLPGNFRDLRNMVSSLLRTGDFNDNSVPRRDSSDSSDSSGSSGGTGAMAESGLLEAEELARVQAGDLTLDELKTVYCRAVYKAADDNCSLAGRQLGIDRRQVKRIIGDG
ncbi:MAG: sigma 54-interacting transcriptional regulator [bacterium]